MEQRRTVRKIVVVRAGVAILYACAVFVAVQPSRALPGAQMSLDGAPSAKVAFAKAYEEAMRAPIETFEEPQSLLGLARCLSAFDQDKALDILRLTDRWLTEAEDSGKMVRGHEPSEQGFPKPNYTRASGLFLSLAATAAPLEPELSRSYFLKAREWNQHKSPADELLVAAAETGIAIIKGNKGEALDGAVRFCPRTPDAVWVEVGRSPKATIGRMLLCFDSDLAVEFASRLDTEFHAQTLREVARIASSRGPVAGLDYYRQAAASAAKAEDEDSRNSILKECALAIARDDIGEALALIDAISYGGARSNALGECLALVSETDLDRALRLATEGRTADESRGVLDDIARAVVSRDPGLLTEVLGAMDNAYRRGYAVDEAAVALAERGDLEGAMRFVDMIEPGTLRATCLARVASVVAAQDKAHAIAMVDEAIALAIANDLYGRTTADVCKQAALVDRAKGEECFKKALDWAFAADQEQGKWYKYYRVVVRLAVVDPHRAALALRRMPEFRAGYVGNDPNVLNQDVLPHLALADPEMVVEQLRRLLEDAARGGQPDQAQELVRTAALKVGLQREEDAERFVLLLPDDYRRPAVRSEITTARLTRQIVADPGSAEELLQALDPVETSTYTKTSVLRAAAIEIANTDRQRAIEFVSGLADDSVRDHCLASLAYQCRDDLEDVERIVGLISGPAKRAYAWSSVGQKLAAGVPGWQIFISAARIR